MMKNRLYLCLLVVLVFSFGLAGQAAAGELEDNILAAITAGRTEVVERYLDSGVGLNTELRYYIQFKDGRVQNYVSLLGAAIVQNQLPIVEMLISRKISQQPPDVQIYLHSHYMNYASLAINVGCDPAITRLLQSAGYAEGPSTYGSGKSLFNISQVLKSPYLSPEQTENAYMSVRFLIEAGRKITEEDARNVVYAYNHRQFLSNKDNYINPHARKILVFLLDNGMNPSPREAGMESLSPLAPAALVRNDWEIARKALRSANPDGPYLSWAAMLGDEESVKYLLNRPGVNINYQLKGEWGSEVTWKQGFGATPLILGIKSGNDEVVSLLLQKGANVGLKDAKGNMAAHYLASRGKTDALGLVLRRGVDINAGNNELWTPLMCAASSGHSATVDLLLGAGAKTNLVNLLGKSAAVLAEEGGYTEIAARLR